MIIPRLEEKKIDFLVPFVAVLTALVFGFILIILTGGDAFKGYQNLFAGMGLWPDRAQLFRLARSLENASVLALTGLSVALAFRCGLFNIGVEGQFLVGAISAAYFGILLDLPSFITIPLILVISFIHGGLWASIATYLKLKRGVHEVISTIMLNWVALNLIENYLVVGPLRVPADPGVVVPTGTHTINATAQLWSIIPAIGLKVDIIIALLATIAIYLLLFRTSLGYEIRAVGYNQEASRYSGINVDRTMFIAMFISGGLAAISGAVLVMSVLHSYPAVFRPGYGFDGIAMALVGNTTPFGVLSAGLFFGGVRQGAAMMQLVGIHKSFADILQALAVIFVAAQGIIRYLLIKYAKPITATAVAEDV
ncbi:simple sugar transport system permease protein [Candidatus Hakubella thermalkaliphila]|uniref:Simple sugar transport system permease protein n=1 Tax=Candidatus Hakubella thermalkaliphila TaxID=2754717 RepID=A0A6V8NRL0_9ACTN|nr:ABC transporter permease [Candidatus Hakubella thermalkaliphila]GFP22915.1 simple sugar transport system permease protein [Candidatus Hakubella thermalkaliphila]GFP29471.1 simple sugar transport system permease protein [Candidatus Hakubella thermalkaliphila]GFP41132.1 simple sugar transport system permease protein [Candidatus Hakubella thermalkaliphila]